jgi:hypothetical protein
MDVSCILGTPHVLEEENIVGRLRGAPVTLPVTVAPLQRDVFGKVERGVELRCRGFKVFKMKLQLRPTFLNFPPRITPHHPVLVHFILDEAPSGEVMEYPDIMALLATASGVVIHLFLFRKGEWDVASPSIFVSYVTLFAVTALFSRVFLDVFLSYVTQLAAWHVAGLYGSMLVYRAFFHRLSKYPGPFLARLSTFYITARSMKKLHLYEEVQKLHAQHGDYVRLGGLIFAATPDLRPRDANVTF